MASGREITSREALIAALDEAAELEHAVVCCYLFAAASLKKHPEEGGVDWSRLESIREWQTQLLLVARQEMEHLGLVANLLTAVGGVLAFRSLSFPRPAAYCPGLSSFELRPFSRRTMEGFLAVEAAHDDPESGGGPETVGQLYGRIRRGFERLAASDEMLFVGPRGKQVGNRSVDLRPGLYDMDLLEVVDIDSACRAIDRIVEAGAGPADEGETHYRRFRAIVDELAEIERQDPDFEPARRVAANPVSRPDLVGPRARLVEHPVSRRAAELFSLAYDTMNLMLGRYYDPPDGVDGGGPGAPTADAGSVRQALRRILFFPLMTMVVRPLGELLTRMPLDEEESGLMAGPTFGGGFRLTLPSDGRSALLLLHERLTALQEAAASLEAAAKTADRPWSRPLLPRLRFLAENLETLAANFERYADLGSQRLKHLLERLEG